MISQIFNLLKERLSSINNHTRPSLNVNLFLFSFLKSLILMIAAPLLLLFDITFNVNKLRFQEMLWRGEHPLNTLQIWSPYSTSQVAYRICALPLDIFHYTYRSLWWLWGIIALVFILIFTIYDYNKSKKEKICEDKIASEYQTQISNEHGKFEPRNKNIDGIMSEEERKKY